MSRATVRAAAGLLAMALIAGSARPGSAQTPAPSPSLNEAALDVRINVWSQADWRGRSDLLRRAAPAGDISRWIETDDPLIVWMRGQSGWTGVVTALLNVSADGESIGCALAPLPFGLPEQATVGLCDRIMPKARYRPALTLEGSPTSDGVRFTIRGGTYRKEDAANMPIVRAEPLPPSPPAPFVGPGWPPLFGLPPARLTGGLPLLQGGGDAAEAGSSPWAGLEVQLDSSGAPSACQAIASSGDSRFDQAACAAARRATYRLNDTTTRGSRVYMLIVQQAGELRALPQSRGRRTSPVINPTAAEALAAEWKGRGRWPRVYVSVDAAGSVTDCRINESSGDDALDLQACQMMRRLSGLTPARDVLDRPTPGSLLVERLPEVR